jgi:DNA-binding Xre family transcriptional regulator
MKSFKQTVNNINKLLSFWKLSINDLSRETDISLTGLKKMMSTGTFKLENLQRISEALKVPLVVLLTNHLSITEKISGNDYREIIISWQVPDVTGVKTKVQEHDALLNVVFIHNEKRQQQEDEIEIINLRSELKEKNDRINELLEKLEMANTLIVMATKATDSYEKYINQLEMLISKTSGVDLSESGKKSTLNEKLNEITEKYVSDLTKKKKD